MMSSKEIIGILILILKLLYQEIFVGEYNKINYRQTLLLVLSQNETFFLIALSTPKPRFSKARFSK